MLPEQCCLKIIAVNDVYKIDQWPHFATCARKETESTPGNVKTISVLPGDFLAPSLLSSIDKGHGMTDCMNKSGINYVCFGNHEADVDMKQMQSRIRESNFTWINSNMQSIPLAADIKLPEYSIVEVSGAENHKRRIALLGLLTEDPSLYRKGAFGDCKIEPLEESALKWFDLIHEREAANGGVDAIIPLTHQVMPFDRQLAKSSAAAKKNFPIIIGGHDHEPYFEDVEGCKIVKTGMDGTKIAIIELLWLSKAAIKPDVSVQIVEAKKFEPDPAVLDVVTKHQQLMEEVMKTQLFMIKPGEVFSSQKMRMTPTTVGTFFCNIVRNNLEVDCAFLNAGGIRGNMSYEGRKAFFYSDLMTELPFESKLVAIKVPGKVIAEAVAYSRLNARKTPPVEYGGYLQTDDKIKWDAETNVVTAINGQPVVDEQLYLLGIPFAVLQGLDNNAPIAAFVKTIPADILASLGEGATDLNNMIVSHFAKFILYDIIMNHNFDDIDANKDGQITKDELAAIAQVSHPGVGSLLVEILFKIADEDGSGHISRDEMLQLASTADSGGGKA